MIGQMSKCIDVVKSQDSHSGKRNIQIFNGGKQEKTLGSGLELEISVCTHDF